MRTTHRRPAFTLVELLVVIGIIAALIGILLPVLSGVASRGRDIQCQSNIRQCVQLFLTYAAENKGQLPYGQYFAKGNSFPGGDWGPSTGDETLITIWSIISRMSSKRYSGEDLFTNPNAPNNNAPFLRCPEAVQVLPHICSYAGNFVAFVDPYDDYRIGIGDEPLVDKPVRTTQCLPFTALMWDTNVQPGMATDVGYVCGADIDGQRFWRGAFTPQFRYYSAHDPFGQFPPFVFGNNKPVGMNTGTNIWKNIDPAPTGPDGFNTYPYQGNLRFRHSKGTACNVGYADGHVAQFVGRFKNDGTLFSTSPMSHDALRKYFMVKWPSGLGIFPNPNAPF